MSETKSIGGQRFGKYLLLHRIARGGMAEIFRAQYEAAAGVTKQVVVKKILPGYADNDRFVQMFIDEARITVRLSHGNIAQVFDFGEVDGEYFLAMEFIHGQAMSTVQERAEEMSLSIPIPIACFVVMEMCRGLHYAHRKNDDRGKPLAIVHRDISPQNVMVSYEGQVKLVDFGIAKAASVVGHTEAGAFKGKYLYFSAEQAQRKRLDGRADICAAGIVLYELLAGQRPYTGPLMKVLSSIVNGKFPRPSEVNGEIPPSLERIVLEAMALDKEDRYQTPLELQEALAGFLFTAAPRFTNADLSHFVQYLFHDELIAEGMSVSLPDEFLEQVPLWRKPGPVQVSSDSSTQHTAPDPSEGPAARRTTRSDATHDSALDTEVGLTVEPRGRALPEMDASRPPGMSTGLRYASYVAVPLVIMAVVAGAVVSLARAIAPLEGAGTVAIESDPSAARIFEPLEAVP